MRRPFADSLVAMILAAVPALAQEPPKTWVDPAAGHRVYRLTNEPGSASLYFNQNGYTADGRKLIDTLVSKEIAKIPKHSSVSTVNAAETLLAGLTSKARAVVIMDRTSRARRQSDPEPRPAAR